MLRPLFYVLLVGMVLNGSAALAQISPLGPVPRSVPYTASYQKQQHVLNEAATKARLAAKRQTLDPNKTTNMDLYDVVAYDLTLNLVPLTRQLTGTTEVRAVVTGPSLDQVELHLLDNMQVTEVRSAGLAAGFTHAGEILAITLDRPYAQGEEFIVAVDYHGDPEGEYFGWDYVDGASLIWSLSEPYGARHWWPCKDLNTDKADEVDLHVTVPENLIVASNGLLTDTTVPGPGLKTYHWESRYPIATYLVSLAIHPFEVFWDWYTGLDGRVMTLEHYVVPSRLGQASASFPVTVDMLEAFAPAFGEYPFFEEKYGHAHFTWGGGMEHQTLTSLNLGAYSEGIISHELAHQWWGDMVTCADFGHIWLNEGFATWCEAYWREVNEGPEAYHEEMMAARYTGGGTIFVEDPNNFWSIFDYNLSYLKASWVPHMLRRVIGDENFFAGLARYRELYAYGSATTEQLRDAMEETSGRDLDRFFQQWIYEPYFPRYQYNYTFSPQSGGQRLNLKIAQIQDNTVIFDMPIEVRVYSPGGVYVDFTVDNDRQEQWYVLDVPDDAIFIVLDPEDWILCETLPGGAADVPGAGRDLAGIRSAHPNPFNPRTLIDFEVVEPGPVELAIHDVSGRRVTTLVQGNVTAGQHQVPWDGTDAVGRRMAAGLYLVRMTTAGQTTTHKITMVQ